MCLYTNVCGHTYGFIFRDHMLNDYMLWCIENWNIFIREFQACNNIESTFYPSPLLIMKFPNSIKYQYKSKCISNICVLLKKEQVITTCSMIYDCRQEGNIFSATMFPWCHYTSRIHFDNLYRDCNLLTTFKRWFRNGIHKWTSSSKVTNAISFHPYNKITYLSINSTSQCSAQAHAN